MAKIIPHQFGGQWTEKKLENIRKYLAAYMKIFTKNPQARYYDTIYVDAFAGTGYRDLIEPDEIAGELFDSVEEDFELQTFFKGSAVIALENQPPFKEYLFLEKNPKYAEELNSLKEQYAHVGKEQYPQTGSSIRICNEEANQFLQDWCQKTNWSKTRAVVFLDPYGMQVKWQTLEIIAKTQSIDLWILFPLGQAVNRLLTRKGLPDESRSKRLTEFFGTTAWQNAFYQRNTTNDLFGSREQVNKVANLETIGKFFVERLSTIFEGVAKNPRELKNSRGNSIYLLCFAASNPKGTSIAIKIAQHILSR